jgi:methionine aminopeptidase
MSVTIKSPDEIEMMRVAGRLASEVLDYVTPFVKVSPPRNWIASAMSTW